MRKAILTLGAGLAAALTAGLAAPAMAGTAPHITGSFSLAGPAQYETINNVSASAGGSLSYTNFTYADPGSGAWSLHAGSPITLNYDQGGTTYSHTLIVDSIQPSGLNSFTFTGHGSYNADSSYTWTASGSVSGTSLSMHTVYTGTNAGYTADTSGTINADGSVTGTASDSLGQALTFSAPAGSAFEALSYTAPVSNVQFPSATTGTFHSAIPAGHVLAGTGFDLKVTDGGSPGTHDTYYQDGSQYQITSGNLVVH